MDAVSSSSSSSEEDEIFRGMVVAMLPVIHDGVPVEQDIKDVGGLGGQGSGRPNREKPRKFNDHG